MKRWKLVVAVVVLLLLGFAGLAWLVLPRFYSEDAATTWTYHSPTHGFSLVLPSSDWEEIKKQDADAAFHNRRHSVLVVVNAAKGQRDAFEKAIRDTQEYFGRSRDELLSEPQFAEGVTDSGNPYAFWTMQAKAHQGGKVFVARSFVWCKDKGLTVSVTMEGALILQSESGKAIEQDFYQNAAKTICLSAE